MYHNNPKYWYCILWHLNGSTLFAQACANNIDPFRCCKMQYMIWVYIVCHSSSNILDISTGSRMSFFKRTSMVRSYSFFQKDKYGKRLTLKTPRKPASENFVYVVCWIFLQTFQTYFYIQANSVNPDQTAPRGAVWSGSTLFAKMTFKIPNRWQSRRKFLWLAV